jgi:hypothetical protein
MTDIELLDKFCETCLGFIDPATFREIQNRGLTRFVNYLPSKKDEAKAVVRGRLSKVDKYVGDPEMEQISNIIARMEDLRTQLLKMNMADVHKTMPILSEIQEHSQFLKDYYR